VIYSSLARQLLASTSLSPPFFLRALKLCFRSPDAAFLTSSLETCSALRHSERAFFNSQIALHVRLPSAPPSHDLRRIGVSATVFVFPTDGALSGCSIGSVQRRISPVEHVFSTVGSVGWAGLSAEPLSVRPFECPGLGVGSFRYLFLPLTVPLCSALLGRLLVALCPTSHLSPVSILKMWRVLFFWIFFFLPFPLFLVPCMIRYV